MTHRLHELMEDEDGALSSKRLILYLLVLFVIIASIAVYFFHPSKDVTEFLKSTINSTFDFLKWLGAFIVGEKPAGNIKINVGHAPPVPSTTTSTVTKVEETHVPSP